MDWKDLKITRYFQEQVLKKRPYLKPEWCLALMKDKRYSEIQEDGRIRLWGYIEEENKYLRLVLLEDGQTVHNAFFDRDFNEKEMNYEVPLLPRD